MRLPRPLEGVNFQTEYFKSQYNAYRKPHYLLEPALTTKRLETFKHLLVRLCNRSFEVWPMALHDIVWSFLCILYTCIHMCTMPVGAYIMQMILSIEKYNEHITNEFNIDTAVNINMTFTHTILPSFIVY